MGWTWFCHLVLGTDLSYSILANPFEPYTIYGAGAVICILVVRPLVKKLNHHIVATFLVATLACAALELLSSIALTIRYGFNPYWSYFDRFMNFNGHICLGNCILFGLLATVFLRLVYPLTEKILRNSNQLVINIFLVVLVIMFGAYYLFPA